jgi:hypothetical protein
VSYTGDGLWSPRANVLLALGPRTSVRLADGRYDQPQSIYSLQVQDGVTRFAQADRSEHRVVGIDQILDSATSVRAEAYERITTRESPRFINLQTKTDAWLEFAADRVLLSASGGRARGVELTVRHHVARGLDWSANYAWARTTDMVEGQQVPRTYDQEHTAYVDASYRAPASDWRLNVAWQIHSGWPEAPVQFAVATTNGAGGVRTNVVAPTFGPPGTVGAARLPWYHRTDIRVTREIQTAHGRALLFADVFNLFGSSNPNSYDYSLSVRNGVPSVSRTAHAQVPRFPSAGISWEF